MKIAQVAPLFESVPPKLYGGTERVVSYLTEELVRLGHDVTLYASGDSRTSAHLVPCVEGALRLSGCTDAVPHHLGMLEDVFRRSLDFDLVHFHVDCLHLPLVSRLGLPHVTTLHGRLDLPALAPLYKNYPETPLVSISDAQRQPLPWCNWVGTVHHGLPRDLLPLGDGGGGYLAFVGRVSPEKRPDRAIEIAKRANLPLKLAAKVDAQDRHYFETHIEPLLDHPLIEFVGEIDEAAKAAFLGNALGLLFPIDWPEPFGLVMIEALACGTPVVAFNCGSVPEIIAHGKNGFIVSSVQEAVEVVSALGQVPRRACRAWFETHFSAERMARDYLDLYESLAATRPVRGHKSAVKGLSAL
ncbi:MAG: glycosyltransferase family 4 protein [Myxococcales bacterium]|nr:glycosyltransferase family 4 protein [Myxococcales bacterium]